MKGYPNIYCVPFTDDLYQWSLFSILQELFFKLKANRMKYADKYVYVALITKFSFHFHPKNVQHCISTVHVQK